MSSSTCPKCAEDGWFHPMGWRSRIMVSISTAFMVFITGLALTMIGIGLPLLIAFPFCCHPTPVPAVETMPPLWTHDHPLTCLERVSNKEKSLVYAASIEPVRPPERQPFEPEVAQSCSPRSHGLPRRERSVLHGQRC